MNSSRQIIVDLAAIDARLKVDHGNIALDAPKGTITPDILQRMKQHKQELLELLQRPIPDDLKAFVTNTCKPKSESDTFPQIDHWICEIERLEPASMRMDKLKQNTLEFLASNWSKQALELGWSEIELFGLINPRRYDGWGLVPAIGLSAHNCQLVDIEPGLAKLETQTGRKFEHEKKPPGLQMARVFWEMGV